MVKIEHINFYNIHLRENGQFIKNVKRPLFEVRISEIDSANDIWELFLSARKIEISNEQKAIDIYVEKYFEPLVLVLKKNPKNEDMELLKEIDRDIAYLKEHDKDIVCYLIVGIDMQDVYSELRQISYDFDLYTAKDKEKDEIIDKLHAENTKYRNGLIEKINESMALDIIQTIDDIHKTHATFSEKEPTEENYLKLLRALNSTIIDLEDILYRQNIESYSCDGDDVNVKRQKVIKTVKTNDPEKHNKIAERLASGFEGETKIIRPERISIYKYTEERKD